MVETHGKEESFSVPSKWPSMCLADESTCVQHMDIFLGGIYLAFVVYLSIWSCDCGLPLDFLCRISLQENSFLQVVCGVKRKSKH